MNGETIKIVHLEDDGLELNIKVTSQNHLLLEDNESLKQIVKVAISKGFSRFVGVVEANAERLEWIFIFSIESYFDNDDMLVNNPVVKESVKKLIAEELTYLKNS